MAKGLNVSGRMSVGRFEKEFEDEFGVKCQIKKGRKLADDKSTLAALRSENFNGLKTVDFRIRGNMLIKNIKDKFVESFGSKIQFYYKNRVAPNDITLGALQRGDVTNSLKQSNNNENMDTTLAKVKEAELTIEVYQEEGNIVALDFTVDYQKDIDIKNFTQNDYYDVLSDEELLEVFREKLSDSRNVNLRHEVDFYDLPFVRGNSDEFFLRISKINEKELSFLCKDNLTQEEMNECKKFLEAEEDIDDLEEILDYRNEFLNENILNLSQLSNG